MIRVSAFVSTYNSAKWLRGRIDNLVGQTLWEQDELEIIVVNSGSKDETPSILKAYLPLGVNFKIITTKREPIYSSWQRAIHLAQGGLVTNANTDDRYLYDNALEVMVDVFDDVQWSVVCADSIVTDTVNATPENYRINPLPPYNGQMEWGDFSLEKLKRYCCVGSAPMWKRSLHDRLGGLDQSYLLAGDYEWFLRCAHAGVKFLHLPEKLTLNYQGDNATLSNQEQSNMEARRALLRWR